MGSGVNLCLIAKRWTLGDEGAANDFVTHIGPVVRSRLRHRHHVACADVDDVSLAVLECGLRQLRDRTFSPTNDVQLITWIAMITKGKAADHWRNSFREHPRRTSDTPCEFDECVASGVAADQDLALEWRDWMAMLPPRVRKAVELHFVGGCELGVTATTMNISESRLRALLGRGKRLIFLAAGLGPTRRTRPPTHGSQQ